MQNLENDLHPRLNCQSFYCGLCALKPVLQNTSSLLVPSHLHLWQKTGKIHTEKVSVKYFNLQTALDLLCCHIKMQFTVSHFMFLWTEWVSSIPGMTENVLIQQTIQNDELHCTDYFWQVRLHRSSSSHAVTIIMFLHSPVSEIVTITDWFLNTRPNVNCSAVPVHLSPQSQVASWQDLAKKTLYWLNHEGTENLYWYW